MGVSRFDQLDGVLISANAEACADAWIAWGKAEPRVMRALQIMFGSPIGMVVLAHSPIAIGIMRHHGLSPMSLFGRSTEPKPSSRGRSGSPPAPKRRTKLPPALYTP